MGKYTLNEYFKDKNEKEKHEHEVNLTQISPNILKNPLVVPDANKGNPEPCDKKKLNTEA